MAIKSISYYGIILRDGQLYNSDSEEIIELNKLIALNEPDGDPILRIQLTLGETRIKIAGEYKDEAANIDLSKCFIDGSFEYGSDGSFASGRVDSSAGISYQKTGEYAGTEYIDIEAWGEVGVAITGPAESWDAALDSATQVTDFSIQLFSGRVGEYTYSNGSTVFLGQREEIKDTPYAAEFAPNWYFNLFINGGGTVATQNTQDFLTGAVNIKDTFTFSAAPEFGRENADHITNFVAKGKFKDTLAITRSEFGISASKASLKATSTDEALFKAAKSKSLFIYDKRDGALYLNSNGINEGLGDSGGVFAILDNRAPLTAGNISLI